MYGIGGERDLTEPIFIVRTASSETLLMVSAVMK
jgi:hypothetical protein